jgi:uncharacterized protein (DUF1800 family)
VRLATALRECRGAPAARGCGLCIARTAPYAARRVACRVARCVGDAVGHRAASRSLLLALHSPEQLREQTTWFWTNHFNVFQGKSNLRAMVGDYEDRAIRPHALGRFRDLLGAATRHPAMLRYLGNDQNAAGRLNSGPCQAAGGTPPGPCTHLRS